jgi:hypothetical protein
MSQSQDYLWVTTSLGPTYDYLAPDGSEIRLLPEVGGGSLSLYVAGRSSIEGGVP